jgi:CelD/BcsL family acetyltransferase involved in cellulose biosynthesis
MQYPEPLIRRLVHVGAARVHAVRTDGRVVAVLLTLVGEAHWMCWLAAQTEEGRRIAASYVAYDAVFAEALAAGISFVNLGASVAAGAEFKGHLGAVEAGMREWTRETALAATTRRLRAAAVASLAVVRRAGGRRQ